MNFIKKVIHGSKKDHKNEKVDVVYREPPATTPETNSNEKVVIVTTETKGDCETTTNSNKVSPCVPPQCNYISKENKTNEISKLKDYASANYYNFFRLLERDHSSNQMNLAGLRGNLNTTGSFVLDEFIIESELTDSCVVSVWTQKYSNKYQQPIEANYQIPLPPYSAVSDFTVTLKDKVLKGKIKENQKAKEKYNDTIASGGQAFLAEKTADGFFKLQVGNLPPGEEVTISTTIISEIGTHLESLHFCIHRFVFPNSPFKFKYNLNVSLSTPIDTIEMDHFKPNITFKDELKTKATVSFTSENGISNNIISVIVPRYSEKPESFIEYNPIDKSNALAINFYPNFSVDSDMVDQKSEFIFLVDCSGSMSGTPIQKCKSALEICMRSLNENSKFNIVCFGSNFKKMFTQSKLYNDESLEEASRYIRTIDADLGGTELLPPMVDILAQEFDPEYPRQVFILTDGEISERDKLIDHVAKEANTTRIFTYGIGSYVDRELVIGLSKACKGFYELILENQNMEEKVMKLISIAMQPTLSNIKIDWNGLEAIQASSVIRPLFNQERMMIYATLEKEPQDKVVTVYVIGNGPLGSPISFPVTLDFNKVDSTSSKQIHTLSAFKRIQDLEEAERKDKKADHKDTIVKLGKKYGLVSKHTSYIVTAESDKVTEESMKSVDVLEVQQQQQQQQQPEQLEKQQIQTTLLSSSTLNTCSQISYDMKFCEEEKECIESDVCDQFSSFTFSAQPTPCIAPSPCAPPPIMQSSPPPPPPSNKCFAPPPPPSPMHYGAPPSSSICGFSPSSYSTPVQSGGKLLELISLQKANGSYVNNSTLSSHVKVGDAPKELESLLDVWATLMVIAKFMVTHEQLQSQWDLVAQKASKFVKQQLLKSNISIKFEDLLESAKIIIAKQNV